MTGLTAIMRRVWRWFTKPQRITGRMLQEHIDQIASGDNGCECVLGCVNERSHRWPTECEPCPACSGSTQDVDR